MPPTKWELREFVKLVDMLDFLREKHRPFTAIAREAVRRGIIKKSDVDSFYRIFRVVIDDINLFEGEFYPYDQTPTGRDRWEWRLLPEISRGEFLRRIHDYVRKHFKRPLYQ